MNSVRRAPYVTHRYMSSIEYISYGQYFSYVINNYREIIMIEIRIERLLENRSKSFYWLAKQTGISHTTLWRLKKGKALGINFITLERLCATLDCQPGDMFTLINQRSQRAKMGLRTHAPGGSTSRWSRRGVERAKVGK